MLLGAKSVGKTSIAKNEKFKENEISTIGIDYYTKSYTIPNDIVIKLKLISVSDDKRFDTIIQTYYKDTMVFIFVFDITSIESFDEAIEKIN